MTSIGRSIWMQASFRQRSIRYCSSHTSFITRTFQPCPERPQSSLTTIRPVQRRSSSSSCKGSATGKENSLGCLDFANAGTVTLPKSGYKFRVPLTCSLGLPETGIDANGIAPDVTIECAYPKTLTNNIDDFVLWVASWLTKH